MSVENISQEFRLKDIHCAKSASIRSYSCLHFPAFVLNTERYGISLRIQSKCGKMRNRMTRNTNTFCAVIDEARNYFIIKINQNELMSEEHKKVCRVLKYIEHLLILISTVTGCVFIPTFASLVGVPVGIISSIGLKIYTITAGIKNHKLIIKK